MSNITQNVHPNQFPEPFFLQERGPERETGLEVDVPLTNPVKSRKGEHAIPTVFKVYSTF